MTERHIAEPRSGLSIPITLHLPVGMMMASRSGTCSTISRVIEPSPAMEYRLSNSSRNVMPSSAASARAYSAVSTEMNMLGNESGSGSARARADGRLFTVLIQKIQSAHDCITIIVSRNTCHDFNRRQSPISSP